LPTGNISMQGLDDKSGMSREVHVRFCEGVGVRFPGDTRLGAGGDPRLPDWNISFLKCEYVKGPKGFLYSFADFSRSEVDCPSMVRNPLNSAALAVCNLGC